MGKVIEPNPNKTIYVKNEELWERVKEKCNRPDINRTVANVTIKLWEMWINGEVMPYPENNEPS